MGDMTTPAKTTPPHHRERRGNLLSFLTTVVTIIAVVKELRTPRDQRTWHGSVGGFVPYDFRVPTWSRVRERIWSPDSSQVLTPAIFGAGWTVNVGRIVALIRDRRS